MRKDKNLSREFQKNESIELFLEKLNSYLNKIEISEYKNLEEKFSTIHIIGAPRSGTTLLVQSIASFINVGYINNLIAAFWKAPTIGIKLSNHLLGNNFISSFESNLGRTSKINEPHEFGYFWYDLLGYPDFSQRDADFENSIDWERVKNTFINMTYAFQNPILFKSFLLGWHAKKVIDILPKTLFIYVKRDIIENALSILKVREKKHNDRNYWAAMKPLEYKYLKEKNYYEQILGQIFYLEKSYLNQLDDVPKENQMRIDYKHFCENPNMIIRELIEKLKKLGNSHVEMRNVPIKPFNKPSLNSYKQEDIIGFRKTLDKQSFE